MKRSLKLMLGGMMVAVASVVSYAQPATPAPSAPTDISKACGKARDPQRCEDLQKAKETCKDKSAVEKRKCMLEAMPPMDCSKARSPERCAALQKAKEACKDKASAEHRQCLREHTPKRGAKAPPKN